MVNLSIIFGQSQASGRLKSNDIILPKYSSVKAEMLKLGQATSRYPLFLKRTAEASGIEAGPDPC
jgi:hypothetical protein